MHPIAGTVAPPSHRTLRLAAVSTTDHASWAGNNLECSGTPASSFLTSNARSEKLSNVMPWQQVPILLWSQEILRQVEAELGER
jgi:hypothetical protein